MPIFVPIVRELGYSPVWFGVLFCEHAGLLPVSAVRAGGVLSQGVAPPAEFR
jgi:hypothetical protein